MPAQPNGTPERCAIYVRQSDPGQSTLPEQLRWAKGLAESSGWPVAVVAEDDGLSGDDLTRPGLAKLEAAFERNHAAGCPITRLIVQKTDRLSRSDSLDAFEVLARLRRHGLRYVVTTLRALDLQNRLDRTLYALEQDHSNNPFLATMAERALSGMAEVARAGFWVGRVPLGYRLERKPGEHGAGKRRRSGRLVIDPETAPLVVELFERYAAGQSTTALAGWLSARAKAPHSPRWSAQAVRGVLTNEAYVGVRRFGRRSRGKHVRLAPAGPVPREAGEGEENLDGALVLRDVPPLVPESLFRRVQQLLAGGRSRGHRRGALLLPLSGLGKCGGCGGPLSAGHCRLNGRASADAPRHRRLFCARRNRYGAEACPDCGTGAAHDAVLAEVIDALAEALLSDGAAERLTRLAEERAAEADRQAKASRQALQRRVAELEAALVRSQRRLVEVSADMLEDTEAGIRQVRQELAEARAEQARQDEERAGGEQVSPERFRAFWQACQRAVELYRASGADFPPTLRPLLAELVEGFTLHWRRQGGRVRAARVDVELPRWLSLLAGSGRPTGKQWGGGIILSADLQRPL